MNLDIAVNEQIHLTEIRATDRTEVAQYMSDREVYDRLLGIPHPYTEDDFDERFSRYKTATENFGEPVHFAIRTAIGARIGGWGFDEVAKGHRAEIGFWLARPYWGQGIMTAVVGKACEYAFAQWNLVRITAHVFDFNVPSARVLEKNGFVCEGYLRKHFLKDGRFIDGKLYALVR